MIFIHFRTRNKTEFNEENSADALLRYIQRAC